MPSGAKRRKAAKKKMEKIAHQQEQGNGDSSKSHDEKDSDSGSLSSPTTSNENQNPLRRDDDEEEEEKFEQSKDFSAIGVESTKHQEVFIKKSQSGGEREKVEEINWDLNQNDDDVDDSVVTKEVNPESRVIDIESVKDPKFGDSFGSSSNGETQVVEKKIELQPEKIEKLCESKEGEKTDVHVVETLIKVEPTQEVVPIVKEVIHDEPVKQVVYQSERAIQTVEDNLAVPIEESSLTDSQSKDNAEKMLPLSNGAGVETSNGSGQPIEAHTPENSNNQKDVALVLPVVQPTSWKSCCGLFDVLVGSNR